MKNRIVYALVDITDGQIFKNKFYIKRPSNLGLEMTLIGK